jgi:hypothetical protein
MAGPSTCATAEERSSVAGNDSPCERTDSGGRRFGTVEPLILAPGTGSLGKSALEEEHQRLGHIGGEKLLDLANAGKPKESHEELRKASRRVVSSLSHK